MTGLAEKSCSPVTEESTKLSSNEIQDLLPQIGQGWQLTESHRLERKFTFPDFASALDFVNQIGAVAEAENHHPDLFLAWGQVSVQIWTHVVNGLTQSDCILAAKIEKLHIGA